jgi:peptidoglycan/xylan/chitin deacetylase (PgdA/CDA1 family)
MRSRLLVAVVALLVLVLLVWAWAANSQFTSSADRLLLLVPDGTSFSDPRVTVWLDAGSEEGLHVIPVHDSELVRPFRPVLQCAGMILPDSVHRTASDVFVTTIHNFVASGGTLMLVYDAGTLSLQGRYAAEWSRFSDLAGIDYALYDTLQDKTIQWAAPAAAIDLVRQMDIPPGKYYPFRSRIEADVNPLDATDPVDTNPPDYEVQLRRYKFGELQYPSFVTTGTYSGQVLFHSQAGVVAGVHTYKAGNVFFVNLPLGYLKANTDGLPLHVFLKYFAEHVLSLPYLMSVPDGVGGLVLNWHVDSNAAIKPLEELESWTLTQQGPYSIDVTAGPDDVFIGDKKGFDVEHNQLSQELIRKYEGMGHQIGSHGGWAHDYFAAHVDYDKPRDLEQFLSLNRDALEGVTGKPVVSYSAPSGDQPKWVTHWLEAHGFLAYYFTGDTGMGPTQGYRDGVRVDKNIWAFPIAHLDRAAAFEEMSREGYSSDEVEQWLEALTDFVAGHRTVRLVYFHPPGILSYHDVIDRWMEQTANLRSAGEFRWYTTSELATFLNRRKGIRWNVATKSELITIDASHPYNLAHAAWRFPMNTYSEPVTLGGSAHVIRDQDSWIVIAGDGKELRFETRLLEKP